MALGILYHVIDGFGREEGRRKGECEVKPLVTTIVHLHLDLSDELAEKRDGFTHLHAELPFLLILHVLNLCVLVPIENIVIQFVRYFRFATLLLLGVHRLKGNHLLILNDLSLR